MGSPLVSFAVGEADAAPTTAEAGARSARAESAADTPAADDGVRRVADESRTTERESAPAATPNLVGYGAAPASGARRAAAPAPPGRPPRREIEHAVHRSAPHDVVPAAVAEPAAERPRSTPPVRKLAKDLGVDLVLVAAAHPLPATW